MECVERLFSCVVVCHLFQHGSRLGSDCTYGSVGFHRRRRFRLLAKAVCRVQTAGRVVGSHSGVRARSGLEGALAPRFNRLSRSARVGGDRHSEIGKRAGCAVLRLSSFHLVCGAAQHFVTPELEEVRGTTLLRLPWGVHLHCVVRTFAVDLYFDSCQQHGDAHADDGEVEACRAQA